MVGKKPAWFDAALAAKQTTAMACLRSRVRRHLRKSGTLIADVLECIREYATRHLDVSVLRDRVKRKPLRECGRLLGDGIGAIAEHICGCDLATPEKGESGYREAVALMQILLVEIVALVTIVNNRAIDSNWLLVVSYLLLSVVPLLGLFLILRARDKVDSAVRSFNRGTVMFIRWMLGVGTVLVVTTAVLCSMERIPGQIRLDDLHARVYQWEGEYDELGIRKGDKGVEVEVVLSASKFDGEFPDPVVITADIGKALGTIWQLRTVEGYVSRDGQRVLCENEPFAHPRSENGRNVIYWHELRSNHIYTLRLLYSTKDKEASAERMAEILLQKGTIIVSAKGPGGAQ
jgi:hypothetical protein